MTTLDQDRLKRVLACSIPCSIKDERVSYSFEALCQGAKVLGVEMPTAHKTFAMLRGLGFSNSKSDGERRISASWRDVLLLAFPVWRQVEKQLVAQEAANEHTEV